ncbi:MAG TPA: hypothetical protein DDZ90_33890, partial [Planctomycetaceae bacterium]|nr:hypothetical protein [Planctomycetaceae bacterium]
MILFCVTANTGLLQAAADDTDSADVKTLLKTAYDHRQHGRYEESREVYDKAAALLGKTSPPNAEQNLKLQRGLIELDRLTGKSRAALQRVEAAIKQAPERPLLHAIGAQ